ncbi:MAG: glycosyltransferase [Paracoccaceae bacterium]
MPDRTFALVVTFDRLGSLKQTVARLLEAAPEHLAGVLVVDNASTDGTADWLAAQDDPRLSVLRLPSNVGGAGGFEAGMRHATQTLAFDWLVLMDDDARPDPGAMAAFAGADRTGADAWVSGVWHPGGPPCEMNRPILNPFGSWRAFAATALRGRDGFHVGNAAYGEGQPVRMVDGGSFVGLFVSRRAVELAGYPDGALFIYGDDALWCLGLRRAGGRVAFDPALRWEHAVGTEMGAHPIAPLWKVYFMYRNQLILYRRVAGPVAFWPIAALKALGWRRRAGAYGPDRAAYLTLWRRALRDGLRRRTGAGLSDVRAWLRG